MSPPSHLTIAYERRDDGPAHFALSQGSIACRQGPTALYGSFSLAMAQPTPPLFAFAFCAGVSPCRPFFRWELTQTRTRRPLAAAGKPPPPPLLNPIILD